eukprot:scaffold31838_cov61-Attheya_sp.AAC.3
MSLGLPSIGGAAAIAILCFLASVKEARCLGGTAGRVVRTADLLTAGIDLSHTTSLNGDGRRLEVEESVALDGSSSACSVPFLDGLVFAGNSTARYWLKPSFFAGCVASLRVDKDNMLQHIANLNRVYKQYYAFYQIAKDPSASEPKNHQADLGYSIFGEGQGQVNVQSRLADLEADVGTNGATARTFWDIAETFNLLRDAHVSLPQLSESSVAREYHIIILPARCAYGGTAKVRSKIYTEDGKLQMKMLWQYPDGKVGVSGREDESLVESIDGKTVEEFVTALANNAALGTTLQASGARLNQLVTYSLTGADYDVKFADMISIADPTKILPDMFNVTYADRSEEVFHTAISSDAFFALNAVPVAVQGKMYTILNTTQAEAALNQPGKMYGNLLRAIGRVDEVIDSGAQSSNATNATVQEESPMNTRMLQTNEDYVFDDIVSLPNVINGGTVKAAYKITEEYAVLKLQAFSVSPLDIISLWHNVSVAAKEQGVDRLIIDISNNGGGVINAGNVLSVAMFPNVGYKWFKDRWDVALNAPMNTFIEVLPALNDIISGIKSIDLDFLQDAIDGYTPEVMNSLVAAAESMYGFCVDNCNLFGGCQSCQLLDSFLAEMNNFKSYSNPVEFIRLIDSLAQVLSTYNPLSVLGFNLNFSNNRTVIRGGVDTVLSAPLTFFDESLYYQAAAVSYQTGHSFKEYIILSNGVAGSTTSIFESTVTQLWQNQQRSAVDSSLTTVSYGGTSNAEDITMAGFPATVQDVHLDRPFIAYGALFMLTTMIPESEKNTVEILSSIVEDYEASLAYPPYFAESLPRMPVASYYSNFMQPGALPLQYVKLPPNEHIPQVYTGTYIDGYWGTSDLAVLYEEASKFFAETEATSQKPTENPTPGGTEPKPAPSHATRPGAVYVGILSFCLTIGLVSTSC